MQLKTYLVLLQYREMSEYADLVGRRYHFPRKYFNLLRSPDIEFIYYEPKKNGEGVYFGYGRVGTVTPDPIDPNQFFADLLDYIPFRQLVQREDEKGQMLESGPFYNAQKCRTAH